MTVHAKKSLLVAGFPRSTSEPPVSLSGAAADRAPGRRLLPGGVLKAADHARVMLSFANAMI